MRTRRQKASACGMTTSAVNRYPIASARTAETRDRKLNVQQGRRNQAGHKHDCIERWKERIQPRHRRGCKGCCYGEPDQHGRGDRDGSPILPAAWRQIHKPEAGLVLFAVPHVRSAPQPSIRLANRVGQMPAEYYRKIVGRKASGSPQLQSAVNGRGLRRVYSNIVLLAAMNRVATHGRMMSVPLENCYCTFRAEPGSSTTGTSFDRLNTIAPRRRASTSSQGLAASLGAPASNASVLRISLHRVRATHTAPAGAQPASNANAGSAPAAGA